MDGWSAIARVYHPLTAGSIDGTDNRPHDRAVERAMKANYMPPNPDSDPHCTLFVARLNPETTEKTLQKVFSKFGDVREVKIVRDIVTGFSKQYAFVEFEEERGARRARQEANESVVEEHIIFVDWECERTLPGWIPRRFGGGFGGKKESGQLRFGGRDRPFRKPILLSSKMDNMERAFDSRDRNREGRDKEREGDRGRQRDRERERGGDRGGERDRDREREREGDRGRGDRDRDRDRDKYRERDRERTRDRGGEREKDRRRDQDRDRDRDRYREREGRYTDRDVRKGRYVKEEDSDSEEERKESGEL